MIMKTTDTTNETVERLKAGVNETVEKVAEASNKAVDTINQKTEQMKDAEERLMEHARMYVRDNPVTSLGIAVASGFILSRLLGRR
jgi:ElaB/YqjD/DUF883 family membrane-anchored ribosome-binding protein